MPSRVLSFTVAHFHGCFLFRNIALKIWSVLAYFFFPCFVTLAAASVLFVETSFLPFFGGDASGEGLPFLDKIFHFFLFLFLSLVYHRSLLSFYTRGMGVGKIPKGVAVLVVLLGVILAAGTEWVQEVFTSTRSGDFYDFFSDVLGIFFYIQFRNYFAPIFSK